MGNSYSYLSVKKKTLEHSKVHYATCWFIDKKKFEKNDNPETKDPVEDCIFPTWKKITSN